MTHFALDALAVFIIGAVIPTPVSFKVDPVVTFLIAPSIIS
jgi:hypothetical protein